KEEQKSFYDDYYALTSRGTLGDFKKVFVMKALKLTPIDHGSKVLEIGCGDGTLTGFLLKAGAFVTAVDISKNAISGLKKKYAHEIKSGKLKAYCSDAVKFMTGKTLKFDTVTGAGLIHHIPKSEWEIFFKKIFNSLNKGGSMMFAPEPNAGGLYGIAWRSAPFFYNKIYRIPYDREVEKGTFDMKPKDLEKYIKEAGFHKAEILTYQVIPHFSSGILAKFDYFLSGFIPGRIALYISVSGRKK
ncbi:MAG: methyltransferase domain-containing protein, partial [Spirochaetes bacterium]|nr:methyltransferase domain-containing protein [Spirochaetota bacterium]